MQCTSAGSTPGRRLSAACSPQAGPGTTAVPPCCCAGTAPSVLLQAASPCAPAASRVVQAGALLPGKLQPPAFTCAVLLCAAVLLCRCGADDIREAADQMLHSRDKKKRSAPRCCPRAFPCVYSLHHANAPHERSGGRMCGCPAGSTSPTRTSSCCRTPPPMAGAAGARRRWRISGGGVPGS